MVKTRAAKVVTNQGQERNMECTTVLEAGGAGSVDIGEVNIEDVYDETFLATTEVEHEDEEDDEDEDDSSDSDGSDGVVSEDDGDSLYEE